MRLSRAQPRRAKAAGGRLPLICAPVVGRGRDALLAEAAKVLATEPDLLEWRVDFFDDIARAGAVIDVARGLKALAGDTPLLFTLRSMREGGEPISLAEEEVVELYAAVCAGKWVDLIDFEMSNAIDHVHRLRQASRNNDIGMIMSYHNFRETPAAAALNQQFRQAQELGADFGKVAVMPNKLEDVLTLLGATLQSSQELAMPLIGISMGAYGALTRLFGWVFGSAVTFAVGEAGSAPGQLPIEELNAAIAIVEKALFAGHDER